MPRCFAIALALALATATAFTGAPRLLRRPALTRPCAASSCEVRRRSLLAAAAGAPLLALLGGPAVAVAAGDDFASLKGEMIEARRQVGLIAGFDLEEDFDKVCALVLRLLLVPLPQPTHAPLRSGPSSRGPRCGRCG